MSVDALPLTAAQAAARLGIKPATLYAYVSRGLIPRRRSADGRTSLFAPADVERLAKRTPHSRLAPTDIVVPTSISLIDGRGGRLWYRGVDAIEASEEHLFEDVAEFLWTGRWNAPGPWEADPVPLRVAQRAQHALPRSTPPFDRIAVSLAVARAADAHRDDRSPDGVVRTARNLLACVVDSLPLLGPEAGRGFAARVWARLTSSEPSDDELGLLDTMLGLLAEHGVTLSVVAVRLAASAGADLYAAMSSGLGAGVPPVDPYTGGDPRARAMLAALRRLSSNPAKHAGSRDADVTFATSEVTSALGLAEGSAELITAVARIAGWLAHAMSEYRQPTPFRPHATYIGTLPAPEQRAEPNLLHAVQNYLRDE